MSTGVPPKSWQALIRHNDQRSARAALRDAGRAREALTQRRFTLDPCGSLTDKHYFQVLEVRYMWPTASLYECANKLGLTKDTYASRLRRALKQAEKHTPEHHQPRG